MVKVDQALAAKNSWLQRSPRRSRPTCTTGTRTSPEDLGLQLYGQQRQRRHVGPDPSCLQPRFQPLLQQTPRRLIGQELPSLYHWKLNSTPMHREFDTRRLSGSTGMSLVGEPRRGSLRSPTKASGPTHSSHRSNAVRAIPDSPAQTPLRHSGPGEWNA